MHSFQMITLALASLNCELLCPLHQRYYSTTAPSLLFRFARPSNCLLKTQNNNANIEGYYS